MMDTALATAYSGEHSSTQRGLPLTQNQPLNFQSANGPRSKKKKFHMTLLQNINKIIIKSCEKHHFTALIL